MAACLIIFNHIVSITSHVIKRSESFLRSYLHYSFSAFHILQQGCSPFSFSRFDFPCFILNYKRNSRAKIQLRSQTLGSLGAFTALKLFTQRNMRKLHILQSSSSIQAFANYINYNLKYHVLDRLLQFVFVSKITRA